ncbi:cholesterol 22-hydroxylase CYP90B27 [Physcomitrium patens]|uniref:Cytochrome P450 n=1 Tax=Physcomitrium patens TaxID=3218 RepID=A0A2K1K2E2_PHYPA|nr:cytochrome P450 85A1-like [Physcomitrium patens]PNR47949.1 hypothetical protein PHYPA_012422 [Physcomitrium patens]|eukprot:XP_024383790.1 cytochrome P450 85A1-like [Physcomitrella patens]
MDTTLVLHGLEIVAFICVSLTLIMQLWSRNNEQAKINKRLPGGSFGLPLLGETLKYMASMKTSMPTFMAEHRQKYGEMFKSKLMGAFCIVTTKSDTIKWVLAHEGKQFVTGYPKSFRKVLGEYTALSLHGEQWKSTRRFLVNSLRVELLKERIPMIEQTVLENLNSWAIKGCVSIREETKTLAFNVVAQYLLGSRLKSGPVNDSLRNDFYVLTEGLFALPINFPGTNFRNALEARARILKTLEEDIVSKPRPAGDEDQYVDYMDYMRKENLPGTTDELLREKTRCHILGLLFAGHETAASAMLFAVKYIMDNPRVWNELRAEHDNIQVSKFEGGNLTWDDYKNMRFSQSVITETLRLANPVALLWREATEDVQLNGSLIPKGWKTVCAIREAHHDPEFFDHPHEFNPWRHQHEVLNPAKKPPLLAFGGGPRYCPGAELARAELCIFLHHLVTKFDLKACETEIVSFFPVPMFSNGLQVRVQERDPATKCSQKIMAY